MSPKKKKKAAPLKRPSIEEIEIELKRISYQDRFQKMIRKTVGVLLVIAAISVLFAMLIFPVLQINGTSMSSTLQDGDVVVAINRARCKRGDIIAFHYNNNILIKRVIATGGQWVDIDDDGVVYVNGTKLTELYVDELAVGECDITLPYQVPEGRYFVLGDKRSTSIDSRTTVLGCVSEEMIIGKILAKVYPLSEFGKIPEAVYYTD